MVISGWHINGHGVTCWNNFNLSYIEGVRRTVGEDVEKIWVGINPLAPNIHKMGPAAHHDTLNNHWNKSLEQLEFLKNHYIWFVVLSPAYLPFLKGKLFTRHFQDAFKMSTRQSKVFD